MMPCHVMCKKSLACGQVVRCKKICSAEEKLNSHLEQLKRWLLRHGYREDHVDSEIERVNLAEITVSFHMRDKKADNSITLGLTYHPALKQLYEVLRRSHKHVLKPPRHHSGLPSPTRVAFRNPKAIRDKIVRFKLKEFTYKDVAPIFVVIL